MGRFRSISLPHREDILSGFLVFLIALPLCLGISLASGFPPMAGIITAVIGGLIVSFFRGSELTIKGPAAGLIVIALGAATELGQGDPAAGYRFALACIAAAGLLQMLFGWLRAGVLGDIFPAAAVKGMMAAIGLIIASKQIHIMLGVKPSAHTPLGLILEIPYSLRHLDPASAVIGGASLALLLLWPRFAKGLAGRIPPALAVLMLAVPLAWALRLDARALVQLPGSMAEAFVFPDFSQFWTPVSVKYIFLFAIVGSIESVLITKAVDLLDPQRRQSDLNRDLAGIGAGNLLAGLLGGLPMISEIVRSSANVSNGARSYWANFMHGLFLLLFVALAPGLIHLIPLAALAAMLVLTGYRLAAPEAVAGLWKAGRTQFAVFFTTLVITLLVDLLAGILAGMLLKLLIHFANGLPLRYVFRPGIETEPVSGGTRVRVVGALVFTNYLPLRQALDRTPADRPVFLDLQDTRLVDHSVQERLEEWAQATGRLLHITGLEGHGSQGPHPHAVRRKDAEQPALRLREVQE